MGVVAFVLRADGAVDTDVVTDDCCSDGQLAVEKAVACYQHEFDCRQVESVPLVWELAWYSCMLVLRPIPKRPHFRPKPRLPKKLVSLLKLSSPLLSKSKPLMLAGRWKPPSSSQSNQSMLQGTRVATDAGL